MSHLHLFLPSALSYRSEGGKPGKLVGYAAKFGSNYELYPGLIETIAPGAFTRTLKEKPDVRALANHDTNLVLGRTTAGTLRLFEDETGLGFELDPPDTQAGRDTVVSVERGDTSGCSFGFRVMKESFQNKEDGSVLRTLEDVELHEISICAFPAYEDTEVSVRASLHGLHYDAAARAVSQAWIDWARHVL